MTQSTKLNRLNQALLSAVNNEKWVDVIPLVRAGASVFTESVSGESITTMLAGKGKFDLVQKLMDMDIKVLDKTSFGSSPFIAAIIGNNVIAIEMAQKAPHVLDHDFFGHDAAVILAKNNNITLLLRLAAIRPDILNQKCNMEINVMQHLTLHRNFTGIGELNDINHNASRLALISQKMKGSTIFIENSILEKQQNMIALLLHAGFAKPANFDQLLDNEDISMDKIIIHSPKTH